MKSDTHFQLFILETARHTRRQLVETNLLLHHCRWRAFVLRVAFHCCLRGTGRGPVKASCSRSRFEGIKGWRIQTDPVAGSFLNLWPIRLDRKTRIIAFLKERREGQ